MKRSPETIMRTSLDFMASLFKPTPVASTMNSLPSLASKPAKSAVIDWQLSKPEVINVNTLSIHNIHYTSLRDITFNTDSMVLYSNGGGSSPRTRMKNHLVEQAARAYLQPLNVESKHATQFFPWNWQKLMSYTPLTFNMKLHQPQAPGCFMGFLSSLAKKLSFSGTLKYLLGRVRQPVRFLQPRIY